MSSNRKKKGDHDHDHDYNQEHNHRIHEDESVWAFLSCELHKSDGHHPQHHRNHHSADEQSRLQSCLPELSLASSMKICSAIRDLILSCVEEPSTPAPTNPVVPRDSRRLHPFASPPRHSPSPAPSPLSSPPSYSSPSHSPYQLNPTSPSYSPVSPSPGNSQYPKKKKISPTLVTQGPVTQNPVFAPSSSPSPVNTSPWTRSPNGKYPGTHGRGAHSSLSHEDREQLRQEKAALFAKPPTTPPKKWEEVSPPPAVTSPVVSLPVEDLAEVAASLKGPRKLQIERLAMLYARELVAHEKRFFFQDVYNLVRLLLLGGLAKIDGERADGALRVSSEKDFPGVLQPKAACVYFACQALWHCRNVIELFDIRVLKLLFENERIKHFDQALADHLSTIQKLQDRKKVSVPVYKPPAGSGAMLLEPVEDSKNLVEHQQHGIYVNFQKSRNSFYDLMDQSERSVERGAEYRSRIALHVATLMKGLAEENLRKFATFFKDSLLVTLVSSPSLRNLEQRLSHNTAQGKNALIFTSQETFYADFIHAADRHKFNSLLLLIFSEELESAAEAKLLEEDESGNRDSMLSKIIRYRTISKFYSFVKYGTFWVGEFPPPFIDNQLLHSTLGIHSLPLTACLARAHEQKTLILNLPWILEFLKVIFLRDNSSRLYLPEAQGLSRAVNFLVAWHFSGPLTALGPPKETRLAIFSLLSQIGDLLPPVGPDTESSDAGSSPLFSQEVGKKLGMDDCEYAKENLLEVTIPVIPALVTLLAENKVVLPKNRKVLPTTTQKIPAPSKSADQMATLESWFFWQTPGQKLVAEVVSERVVKGTNSVEEIERLAKQMVKSEPQATFPQIQEKVSGALQGLFDDLFARRIKMGVEALSPPDLLPEVIQNTCGFALKLGFSYLKETALTHMDKEVFRANVIREQQRLTKQTAAEIPPETPPGQEVASRVDFLLRTYGANPALPNELASLGATCARVQQALPALLLAPPAPLVSIGADLAHLMLISQQKEGTDEVTLVQSQVIALWEAAFARDKTLSLPIRQLLNASFRLHSAEADKPTVLLSLLAHALRKGLLSPTKLIEARLEFHAEFVRRPWGSLLIPILDALEREPVPPFPPETFAALRSAWGC